MYGTYDYGDSPEAQKREDVLNHLSSCTDQFIRAYDAQTIEFQKRRKVQEFGSQFQDLDNDLIEVGKKLEELVRQNMADADNADRQYDVQFGLLGKIYAQEHSSQNIVLDIEKNKEDRTY